MTIRQASRIGVGFSAQTNSTLAGKEAAQRALQELSVEAPMLALVFASSWLDSDEVLSGVRSVLGQADIIGTSTDGQILSTDSNNHGCVVLVLGTHRLTWGVGVGEGLTGTPRAAGQQVAYQATRVCPTNERSGFLLFGDGTVTRPTDILRGAQEVLGTTSLVIGALSGGSPHTPQAVQFANHRTTRESVVGVLFGANARIGFGLEHGFAPISKPRRITRADGTHLLQLDEKPAAAVYEEYFGADMVHRMQSEGLSRAHLAYPLGIQQPHGDRYVLRNVVAFGKDASLFCNAEIPQGSWMQLMISNQSLAVEAAQRASQQAISQMNRPLFVLVFSSFSRAKLFGRATAAEELEAIRHTVGERLPIVGFHSNGELISSGAQSPADLAVHSGAILIVAVGE